LGSCNFVQCITTQMYIWSSPLCRAAQVDSNEIYLAIFEHFYESLLIFEIWKKFGYLKQTENDFKPWAQCWAENGPRPQCRGTAACLLPGPRPARFLASSRAGRRGTHSVHSHRAHGPRCGMAGCGSPVDGKRRGLQVEQ
jgi:hypothetical protein